MKYFLTGATGFIGERVARQLIEAGHEVAHSMHAVQRGLMGRVISRFEEKGTRHPRRALPQPGQLHPYCQGQLQL